MSAPRAASALTDVGAEPVTGRLTAAVGPQARTSATAPAMALRPARHRRWHSGQSRQGRGRQWRRASPSARPAPPRRDRSGGRRHARGRRPPHGPYS